MAVRNGTSKLSCYYIGARGISDGDRSHCHLTLDAATRQAERTLRGDGLTGGYYGAEQLYIVKVVRVVRKAPAPVEVLDVV